MKKLLVVLFVIAISAGVHLLSGRPNANASVTIQSGDLIRGQTFNAVYYYGKDGFRYVFPNEKTYFTWYSDFSGVKMITDAQLGDIQIGGNVTYRPGVKMIKINTDPKTYAIGSNGTLRHVTSEQVARDLYGGNWNKQIDDVPDAFFSNYTMSDAIAAATEFNRSAITGGADSINNDKGLQTPVVVTISDSGYSPASVTVEAGRVVKFTNGGTMNHTVTGDDLTWGSGTMNAGKSFSRKFTKAGTFGYSCSYHPNMTGAVFVQ